MKQTMSEIASIKTVISDDDANKILKILRIPESSRASFMSALETKLTVENILGKKTFRKLYTGKLDINSYQRLLRIHNQICSLLAELSEAEVPILERAAIVKAFLKIPNGMAPLIFQLEQGRTAVGEYIESRKPNTFRGRKKNAIVTRRKELIRFFVNLVIGHGGQPKYSSLGGSLNGKLAVFITLLRSQGYLQINILDNVTYDQVEEALGRKPKRPKSSG